MRGLLVHLALRPCGGPASDVFGLVSGGALKRLALRARRRAGVRFLRELKRQRAGLFSAPDRDLFRYLYDLAFGNSFEEDIYDEKEA